MIILITIMIYIYIYVYIHISIIIVIVRAHMQSGHGITHQLDPLAELAELCDFFSLKKKAPESAQAYHPHEV